MMKKFAAMILVCMMMVSCASVSACAESIYSIKPSREACSMNYSVSCEEEESDSLSMNSASQPQKVKKVVNDEKLSSVPVK